MAEAVVEERHLVKSLRWWDGFTIAMCNPGFLFGSLGFTLGIFGVLGSVILWFRAMERRSSSSPECTTGRRSLRLCCEMISALSVICATGSSAVRERK